MRDLERYYLLSIALLGSRAELWRSIWQIANMLTMGRIAHHGLLYGCATCKATTGLKATRSQIT